MFCLLAKHVTAHTTRPQLPEIPAKTTASKRCYVQSLD